MKRLLIACLGIAALGINLAAVQSEEEKRLDNAAKVLTEILSVPEGIPHDLLAKAHCVVVIPSVVKVAVGIGGSHGRGAMVCRTGPNFAASWGPPAMYSLEGGSFGLQLGAEATDFVLLVTNSRGVDSLLSNKVKLGADISAAAGPKGRDASAATDAAMRAEILSYSRSRGAFAGISLEGSTVRPDDDANERLYGKRLSARDIVTGGKVNVPPAGKELVSVLSKAVPVIEGRK